MKKISAGKLAEILKAEILGDKNVEVTGVAKLSEAQASDVSFMVSKKYIDHANSSKAVVILVPKDFEGELPKDKTILKCGDANTAFSTVINYFAPPKVEYKTGIHPTAIVADSAKVPATCHVGAHAVIEENAVIGENSVIAANVYIGHETKLGSDCLMYPGVVVRERCIIGNKVIIHPNTSIGADGFGYAPSPFGIIKIPQVGIVQIDDEVEIGACVTIDRARFGKTWIKFGAKIDNLVQIAHNVTIGEFSLLVGQCGLAGSTEVGQGVIIAAQAGINGHITLGDGCKIGPCAVVKDSVDPGASIIGYPAVSGKEFMAQHLAPKHIKQLKGRVKELESVIASLKVDLDKLKENN